MSRIIYVPLEHIDGRYTVHMDQDIIRYLNANSIPYVKIEPEEHVSPAPPTGQFLNSAFTSKYKAQQLAMIAGMYERGEITSSDQFFFSDIWFPGIESLAYMNYFHKITPKITGIIHAGSFTDTDFVRDMERWAKNFEDIIFDIADTVFCASNFIRDDIIKKRVVNHSKLVVSGLPLDVSHLRDYDTGNKVNRVIFNGRICDEKQPWMFAELEKRIARKFNSDDVEFVRTQDLNLNKADYYRLLSESKVVVSFALQENFGFGIAEAAYLGCTPVLPNRLVYPELYNRQYLYDNFEQCVNIVTRALDGTLPPVLQSSVPGISEKCFKTWFTGA